jgi:hypothetical protein
MNGLLMMAPVFAAWAYLLFAFFGLAGWKCEAGLFLLLLLLAYLLAFAVVGTPLNAYWGLVDAPLLGVGLAFAPGSLERAAMSARKAS